MRPISMKCSLEQYDEIKPILKQHGLDIYDIGDFFTHSYLVNNYLGMVGTITNISDNCKSLNDRTVFGEWNEDIFLEYCGIRTKYKLLRR